MSYRYQICPDCYGLIKEEMRMKKDNGGVSPAAVAAVVKPVSEFANTLTNVSNQAAERREAKRKELGTYNEKKKKNTVKYFNKLKRQRRMGKLPPNLQSDEQLWDYAITASGLID